MRISPPIAVALLSLAIAACSAAPPDLAPTPGPRAPSTAKRTTLEDLRPFLEKTSDRDYPLYPGDVVQITVKERDDLTVERQIPPTGEIPLFGFRNGNPGGGDPVQVTAAGKRIPELEAELRDLYAKIVPHPYVTVRVTSYAPKVVYVAGEVDAPGEYQLPNDRRISLVRALTKAGWLTESAAADSVRVIRTDPDTGERLILPPIDVERIVSAGEAEMDIPLEPRDLIMVGSRASQSVYIYGKVKEPGEIPYRRGMTLSQLITHAGGLEEFAKLRSIRVLRGDLGQALRVNLQAILDGEAPAFLLEPGDVVYVDETFI